MSFTDLQETSKFADASAVQGPHERLLASCYNKEVAQTLSGQQIINPAVIFASSVTLYPFLNELAAEFERLPRACLEKEGSEEAVVNALLRSSKTRHCELVPVTYSLQSIGKARASSCQQQKSLP